MPDRGASRRFWPGRSSGTTRPPTPTGSRGSAGAPLSSLPGVPGSAASPEERRFAQVYAADRVGPMPYPHQATPDVGAARGRVRSLVSELLDGVDEGTGGALDPLIASWASGWLSRIDSQHADHQAVIDRLVGGARQQLADAEAGHERDRRALAVARRDYDEARERLSEPVGGADHSARPADRPAARPADRTGGRHADRTEAATVPPADPPTVPPADPPTGPMPRRPGRLGSTAGPPSVDRGEPMTDPRGTR